MLLRVNSETTDIDGVSRRGNIGENQDGSRNEGLWLVARAAHKNERRAQKRAPPLFSCFFLFRLLSSFRSGPWWGLRSQSWKTFFQVPFRNYARNLKNFKNETIVTFLSFFRQPFFGNHNPLDSSPFLIFSLSFRLMKLPFYESTHNVTSSQFFWSHLYLNLTLCSLRVKVRLLLWGTHIYIFVSPKSVSRPSHYFLSFVNYHSLIFTCTWKILHSFFSFPNLSCISM